MKSFKCLLICCLLSASPLFGAEKPSVQILRAFDVSEKKPETIIIVDKGMRLITFGVDPETMRFEGQIKGVNPALIRYYWTFEGGDLARVPAQGVSETANSGPVKFTKAGNARLHAVNKDHPEVDLAQDMIYLCYADLKHFGKDCVSYIPEGATLDRHGKIEARSDWTYHTSPPLKGVYLGQVVTSKPKNETIIPPYAITDEEGCVHFTVSRKDSDADWGEIELKDSPSKQDPEQIRRLAEKNRAIVKQDQPKPLEVAVTVDPVTFYKVGVDDREDRHNTVEAIPAFRLHFPAEHLGKLQGVGYPENGIMEGWLYDLKAKYQKQKVLYHLPEPVVSALASFPKDGEGSLVGYMWYHEWDRWRIEDSDYYIQIPKVQRVVYPAEKGGSEIRAVTVLPRNGLLVALSGKQLVAMHADSGKVKWKVPLADEVQSDRMTWINDDLILGTEYGRRFSAYCVISISQKKVIKWGDLEAGAQFFIANGALVQPDPENRKPRTLFTFPQPPKNPAR